VINELPLALAPPDQVSWHHGGPPWPGHRCAYWSSGPVSGAWPSANDSSRPAASP